MPKPATKRAAKSAPKTATKPVAHPKPASKPASKSSTKSAAKAAAKTAPEPAPKTAAKLAPPATPKPPPRMAAKFAPKVKPVPDGYHTATPYLIVRGGASAMEFYKKAFGATEIYRLDMGGKLGHAELRFGDSVIMLADEYPDMGYKSPHSFGGSPVSIMLYVEDCDAVVKTATAAGAKILRPVQDQFYGDRTGTLLDPFGHVWAIATRKENLSHEEIGKRAAAMHG